MEDVLLIERVEDQLKEPERSTGTVLGLELSNVPVFLAASSNTAPSGFSWRWAVNGEKVVEVDILGMFPRFPNHEANSSPRFWVLVGCFPSDMPAISIAVSLP